MLPVHLRPLFSLTILVKFSSDDLVHHRSATAFQTVQGSEYSSFGSLVRSARIELAFILVTSLFLLNLLKSLRKVVTIACSDITFITETWNNNSAQLNHSAIVDCSLFFRRNFTFVWDYLLCVTLNLYATPSKNYFSEFNMIPFERISHYQIQFFTRDAIMILHSFNLLPMFLTMWLNNLLSLVSWRRRWPSWLDIEPSQYLISPPSAPQEVKYSLIHDQARKLTSLAWYLLSVFPS